MPHTFNGFPEFPDSDSVTLKRIASAIESSKSGASSGSPLYVVGNLRRSSASIVRPSNSITYGGSCVISRSTNNPILTFDNVARAANQGGYIQKINLIKTTVMPVNSNFRIHFWSEVPSVVSTLGDNHLFASPFSNRSFYIGYYDLPTLLAGGSGHAAYSSIFPTNLPFHTNGTNKIYGCLQLLAAYNAQANEEFYVEIVCDCY